MTIHAKISYIKSGIRILGYFLLVVNIELAIAALVGAEAFGVIEEFGL